jgi:restriction endonuclease Mrr
MRIFWLDDQPYTIFRHVDILKANGLNVEICTSDKQVKELFRLGNIPDVIIQDLWRTNFLGYEDMLDNTMNLRGWDFYKNFLKKEYPQVKVIICSSVADNIKNIKLADDYNLYLEEKNENTGQTFLNLFKSEYFKQEVVHRSIDTDLTILKIDFDKVNKELYKYLLNHPQGLYKINWMTFEILVTDLLQQLGYQVIHTPFTRDGGVDIWAIYKNELGETKYAIDTKLYSPNRLVGPEPIRAIYGVTQLEQASIGMIITSSFFSEEAKKIANQFRYKISLRDFDDIKNWIRTVYYK